MAIYVRLLSIRLNSQKTNASVSAGEVLQHGWSSHNKNNFGNGMLFGAVCVPNSVNRILDNDVVDFPVADFAGLPGQVNQKA